MSSDDDDEERYQRRKRKLKRRREKDSRVHFCEMRSLMLFNILTENNLNTTGEGGG